MLNAAQDLGPQLNNGTAAVLAVMLISSLFFILRFQRRDRRDAELAFAI